MPRALLPRVVKEHVSTIRMVEPYSKSPLIQCGSVTETVDRSTAQKYVVYGANVVSVQNFTGSRSAKVPRHTVLCKSFLDIHYCLVMRIVSRCVFRALQR